MESEPTDKGQDECESTESGLPMIPHVAKCGESTTTTSAEPKREARMKIDELTPPSIRGGLGLAKDIKMREYQKELAVPGVKGLNYILVAPTGTGKTLIASHIIVQHLKRLMEMMGKRGKVVFMTPTQQLTFQQKMQLQKYIPGIIVVEITGASEYPMQPLIQNNAVDVIVCTAGKLRQELKIKNVRITQFTLIIADECHHAGRPSNYTDMMEFYIRGRIDSIPNLPQVVGMTASPGAGRGKLADLLKVMDHQTSLCATLDATAGIKTVTVNLSELERYHNDPKAYLEVKDERNPEDPFIMSMHSAVAKLEAVIDSVPGWTSGSPKYESWLRDEKKAAESRMEDESKRISILDQLIVYSQSLMTYQDFRYEDALSVLDEIEEVPQKSDLEVWLNCVHTGLMETVTSIFKVRNPLLVHMEEILLNQYIRNPDSKGIFFVRSVKHTRYVTDWIQSCPELSRVIRVAPITGHSRGGIQKSEQIRVLKAFCTGRYNLLASTSVLEEGLDVPACNYVIRYQNISNEIAQVQAKGRARAEDSRIYTVVSTHSNREYWYLVQEEKQHIANIAIASLQMCTLERDIRRKQKEFIEERERKAQLMRELRKIWPKTESVKLLCKKCKVVACAGSDVFTYSMGTAYDHYVVPGKTFSKMYQKKNHDKPEISGDFVKPYQIFCRSPNCRNQWGIIGLWRETGFLFPVLKCDKFLFQYNDDSRRFHKWKDIWFKVQSIRDWAEFENEIADDIQQTK